MASFYSLATLGVVQSLLVQLLNFFEINYKNSVRTSQETLRLICISNRLMLRTEAVAVYCDNRTDHTNTLWAGCRVLVS
jgi:hypothetical protein